MRAVKMLKGGCEPRNAVASRSRGGPLLGNEKTVTVVLQPEELDSVNISENVGNQFSLKDSRKKHSLRKP